jgi:hypothetical protein
VTPPPPPNTYTQTPPPPIISMLHLRSVQPDALRAPQDIARHPLAVQAIACQLFLHVLSHTFTLDHLFSPHRRLLNHLARPPCRPAIPAFSFCQIPPFCLLNHLAQAPCRPAIPAFSFRFALADTPTCSKLATCQHSTNRARTLGRGASSAHR